MRPPSILDVVRAVKNVAATRDDVRGWWYAPPKRLRLAGERGPADRHVEIAVEGDPRGGHDLLAHELSRALSGFPVRVRPYRGRDGDAHLFRLVSADKRLDASG